MSGTQSNATSAPTVPAGGKTILRSPQIASRVFLGGQTDNNILQAIPRVKFEFYVQFVLGPSAQQMLGQAKLAEYNNKRGMSFRVKTVDRPKLTLQTEELNQYNKKVIVYKKVEYNETSVKLHDTVDDSILATWVDYFTFYFADSRQKSGPSGNSNQNSATPNPPYEQSPYSASMQWDSGWGFQPIVNNDTNFFTNIIVYALFANTYTAWSYVNPKITSIDWEQFDYASSDTEEVTIQFRYEAINYLAFGSPITNNPYGFMENFGYTQADYIPANTGSVVNTGLQPAMPRIFVSATAPLQNTTTPPQAPTNNISNPSGSVPTANDTATTTNALQNATVSKAPGTVVPVEKQSTITTIGKTIDFGRAAVGAGATSGFSV